MPNPEQHLQPQVEIAEFLKTELAELNREHGDGPVECGPYVMAATEVALSRLCQSPLAERVDATTLHRIAGRTLGWNRRPPTVRAVSSRIRQPRPRGRRDRRPRCSRRTSSSSTSSGSDPSGDSTGPGEGVRRADDDLTPSAAKATPADAMPSPIARSSDEFWQRIHTAVEQREAERRQAVVGS
jgi:hypothetical protein